jgi:UDP-N-acetylmuramate-alanine ligase
MSVAKEMADENGQKLIVVYEPLTNRRQHFMKNEYKNCFKDADKLLWVPSYLAREDPDQEILTPEQLIACLDNPEIATAMKKDDELLEVIKSHLEKGDMVVAMAGGGGNSLDDWLRQNF